MTSSITCTTRSRTGLFLSFRESIPRSRRRNYNNDNDDDEQEYLISTPRHMALDVSLPPKWVDFSDQVELILADTKAKITALEKLHAKHVLPGFADRSPEEREIEALTTDITRDFRQCQTLIQRIGLPQHSFPPESSGQVHSEAVAAKNVQRGLAVKVQDLSVAFRKKQRIYMEKLQGHAIKNQDLLIASGTISLKGSEGIRAVDDDVAAAKHTKSQSQSLSQSQSQALMTSDAYDQDVIDSRTHSLNELANSIGTLAELFKDLSVLIIDQGTVLDSVEYNIEQTAVRVTEAVTVLQEAKGYQRKTGRRQCILFLILLVALAITALVIKIKRGREVKDESGAPTPPPAASVAADVLPVDVPPLRYLVRREGRPVLSRITLIDSRRKRDVVPRSRPRGREWT